MHTSDVVERQTSIEAFQIGQFFCVSRDHVSNLQHNDFALVDGQMPPRSVFKSVSGITNSPVDFVNRRFTQKCNLGFGDGADDGDIFP